MQNSPQLQINKVHFFIVGGLNVCLFLATMAWHNLLEGIGLGIQTDKVILLSLVVTNESLYFLSFLSAFSDCFISLGT